MRNHLLMLVLIIGVLILFAGSTTATTVHSNQSKTLTHHIVGTQALIQEDPDISGNLVVYRKTKYPGTSGWSMDEPVSSVIYWKNIVTGATGKVTTSTAKQWNPAISGTHVIWLEETNNGFGRLYYRNLARGSTTKIASSIPIYTKPDISGTNIAWSDYKSGISTMYVKNLLTGSVTKIKSNADISNPIISGNKLVWGDYISGHSYVHFKNLLTGSTAYIGTNQADHPYIDGNRIVWDDYNGIYYKNLVTGSVCRLSSYGYSPKISGNSVIWEYQSGSYAYVHVKNLVSKAVTTVIKQRGGQFGFEPEISGNIVVWQDWVPHLFVDYWKNLLTGVIGRVQV
jgi:TolB protein